MAETYKQKTGIYPTLPRDEPDNRDPNGINKHLQVRKNDTYISYSVLFSLA